MQTLLFEDDHTVTPPQPKKPRPRSKKQVLLFAIADANQGSITLNDAVTAIGGRYFTNARKHVGRVLARMVRNGLLVRTQRGVFNLA